MYKNYHTNLFRNLQIYIPKKIDSYTSLRLIYQFFQFSSPIYKSKTNYIRIVDEIKLIMSGNFFTYVISFDNESCTLIKKSLHFTGQIFSYFYDPLTQLFSIHLHVWFHLILGKKSFPSLPFTTIHAFILWFQNDLLKLHEKYQKTIINKYSISYRFKKMFQFIHLFIHVLALLIIRQFF